MKRTLINFKTFIFILGLTSLFATTTVMIYTFFIAYFNGYSVIVTINDYNEANAEFILILLLIPCMIYAIAKSMKLQTESI